MCTTSLNSVVSMFDWQATIILLKIVLLMEDYLIYIFAYHKNTQIPLPSSQTMFFHYIQKNVVGLLYFIASSSLHLPCMMQGFLSNQKFSTLTFTKKGISLDIQQDKWSPSFTLSKAIHSILHQVHLDITYGCLHYEIFLEN